MLSNLTTSLGSLGGMDGPAVPGKPSGAAPRAGRAARPASAGSHHVTTARCVYVCARVCCGATAKDMTGNAYALAETCGACLLAIDSGNSISLNGKQYHQRCYSWYAWPHMGAHGSVCVFA
jgi:hypothetical protein